MRVVVGPEVAEAGGGVGEEVPVDDEDGCDGDEGLELAAAVDDASIAFTEEDVCLGVCGGGVAEYAPSGLLRGDNQTHSREESAVRVEAIGVSHRRIHGVILRPADSARLA